MKELENIFSKLTEKFSLQEIKLEIHEYKDKKPEFLGAFTYESILYIQGKRIFLEEENFLITLNKSKDDVDQDIYVLVHEVGHAYQRKQMREFGRVFHFFCDVIGEKVFPYFWGILVIVSLLSVSGIKTFSHLTIFLVSFSLLEKLVSWLAELHADYFAIQYFNFAKEKTCTKKELLKYAIGNHKAIMRENLFGVLVLITILLLEILKNYHL